MSERKVLRCYAACLRMEEGTTNQGMQVARNKEIDVSLEPPEGVPPDTLILSQYESFWTFDLQNYENVLF